MRKYEIKTEEDNKRNYSKTVDEITIELNIPNEWNYEEIYRGYRKFCKLTKFTELSLNY